MNPAARPGLELRDLLTIDVGSELRKLSQAQLQGPWQLPAELVRRALCAGAGHVDVRFARHEVVVVDDGAGLDPGALEAVAALLDPIRGNDQRHHALGALEAAGQLALLASAGVEDLRALIVDTVHAGTRCRLELRKGARPTLSATPAGDVRARTSVTLRSGALERSRARAWLVDVARFAPAGLVVDGAPLVDGAAGALAQAPLSPPLAGRVALMPAGQTAHVHLLAFGLVAAHVTIPEASGFEAALEMGARAEVGTPAAFSPAALRDASLALAPALVDQALALLIATAPAAARSERTRARLAALTLHAARRRTRLAELERVAVFRSVDAGGAALVDLATLRQRAASDPSGAHSLLALAPDERPDQHALGSEPALIADDAERSLLAEILRVRFRAPSPRESRHSFGATLRRLVHHSLRTLGRWRDLLHLPLRSPALADDVLTAPEHALLLALRSELRTRPGLLRDAALCAGHGPVRRTGGRTPTLFLPRHNPIVVASVRAFAADPGWMRLIHPALVAARNTRP